MGGNKILIVDNDHDILELLKLRLENWGYFVIQADNGNEALKIARQEKPNLIILDIAMPGMDGGWVREQLKKMPITEKIPVIFLTCLFTKSEEADFGNLIADQFLLAKPYNPEELHAAIEKSLGSLV
jgi:two-component system, OmpR family, alkaline phosphatase synthesis response regulator PhoP